MRIKSLPCLCSPHGITKRKTPFISNGCKSLSLKWLGLQTGRGIEGVGVVVCGRVRCPGAHTQHSPLRGGRHGGMVFTPVHSRVEGPPLPLFDT